MAWTLPEPADYQWLPIVQFELSRNVWRIYTWTRHFHGELQANPALVCYLSSNPANDDSRQRSGQPTRARERREIDGWTRKIAFITCDSLTNPALVFHPHRAQTQPHKSIGGNLTRRRTPLETAVLMINRKFVSSSSLSPSRVDIFFLIHLDRHG